MTTLREAATQALEALEDFGMKYYENTGEVLHRDVYESLKAALAEEALQRLTDVSQEIEAALAEPENWELRRLREELERCKQVCAATSEAWREEAALGCDHCNSPLYAAVKCRVCGRETPIIEPEIKGDKESAPCNKSCAPGYCYCECPHGVTDGNCKECYEANAEPVQEAEELKDPAEYDDFAAAIRHNERVTTRRYDSVGPVALETVYETIIHWDEGGGKRSRRELARRIVDLYSAPPQRPAEPTEPVAWMVYTEGGTSAYVTDNPNDLVGAYRALPLYTAPPQRKED